MPGQIAALLHDPASAVADRVPGSVRTLRQRAESRFTEQAAHLPSSATMRTPEALHALLHELQVHQIELEMQNDELNRAQTAIDTAQARYFDFYDLAPVGYVTVSQTGLILQANLTMASLLAVTRDRLIDQPISHFIDKDDQDVFYLFRNKLLESGAPLSCELRMIKTGGASFWAGLAAIVVPGADDSTALRIVLSDVTERKQAQERLQLAASVFNRASEGIIVTDANGHITEVNDSFTAITGYSRSDVMGRNPSMLASGRQGPDFYSNMWGELTKHGHWCGELWNRHKNGTHYVQLVSIHAVCDTQGTVQRHVALFSDITAIKMHQQQLERMAYYDDLTGLPNRVLHLDRLQQAMALARRSGLPLAVVYIDLDGFKTINDAHGHDAGDQMLISVTGHMQKSLREGDTLARIGGDEFAAVLVNLESATACLPLLDRLLVAAALPLQLGDHALQVSASLGVSFYPQTQDVEAAQLLRQADQAMYLAKQAGKNRYQVFDAEQDSILRGWHLDLTRLRQALVNGEFVLYYQPKVNLRTGQLVGAEALIRWQHPCQGLLAPAEFLPAFEHDRLAIEVGEWVIDTALTQMARWQANGLHVPVSVNVGARQLQQPDFVARLKHLLACHPTVSPTDLGLEILETSALQDLSYVSQLIEDCHLLGVTFALDDFGTGYSSLAYLKRLRVKQLKIDQSFVRDMLCDPDDQAILQGIMGLAGAFRRDVIAEGVETVAHGSLLLQMGCELAQGYGIARPMPAQEVPGWAATWQPDSAWH